MTSRPPKRSPNERARLRRALAEANETNEILRAENEHLIDSQRVLEEVRDRYADLYDFAPLGLLTVDGGGIIREMNLGAVSMLGLGRRLALGLSLSAFLKDHLLFRRQLAACRRGGAAPAVENVLLCRAGGRPAVEVAMRRTARRDAYRVAIIDVTDRIRLAASEQAARASNEAKNIFMATLSHELRMPLAPVLAAASALRGRPVGKPELARLLEIIERNVLIQSRLVDDLIDTTQVLHGKMRIEREPMPFGALVLEVLEMFAAQVSTRGLQISVDLGAARDVVLGDGARLRQLVWNLFANALKFTPPGGHVAVTTWNRAEQVVLEVRDSGIGLAPHEIDRIFEPFEQAGAGRRGGLGLGLAIARGITLLHGGAIAATSLGPGRGTRLVVELPLTVSEPAARPVPVAAPPARKLRRERRRAKILLVEDHADTAETLSMSLQARGYDVETVRTLRRALRVELLDVSVVVSDLGLPDGDGLRLVRALKKKSGVRAVVLSGYGSETDRRASYEAGAIAHLVKPVTISTLVSAIEKALAAAPSTGN